MALSIMIMMLVSVASLLIISLLTYLLKWKADTAMTGITLTYILTGFSGGLFGKWYGKRQYRRTKDAVLVQQMPLKMRWKIAEGMILGTVFMLLLVVLSLFYHGNTFAVSERVVIIWLLLAGSASLGRII